MPKLRPGEIRRAIDPDDEEYAPTKNEISDDDEETLALGRDLMDMELALGRKKKIHEDDEWGVYDPYRGADPEYMRDELLRASEDVARIHDPQLRKQMRERIEQLEKQMYKQYIPFLDASIQRFGFRQSRQDRLGSTPEHEKVEIENLTRWTREQIEAQAESEDVKFSLLFELDELQEKFEDYQKEPLLYLFEGGMHELHRKNDVRFIWDPDWDESRSFIPEKPSFEDVKIHEAEIVRLNQLLEDVSVLSDMVAKMKDADIRQRCNDQVRMIRERLESKKQSLVQPRESAILQGEMRDTIERIRSGETIDGTLLKEFKQRTTKHLQSIPDVKQADIDQEERYVESEQRRFYSLFAGFQSSRESVSQKRLRHLKQLKSYRGNLAKLLSHVQKAFEGNFEFDKDSEVLLDPESLKNASPWEILGVSETATLEEVKKAYRKLALAYHPDRSKHPEAEEFFKRISTAYTILENMLKKRS